MASSTLAISFWHAYLAAGSVPNRGFTTITPGDNCSQDDFLLRNVADMKCEATLGSSVHKRANCGDFDSQLQVHEIHSRYSEQSRRVALSFYGLTRSVQWTLPTLKRNVISPLNADRIPIDVFIHTYNMTHSTCGGCKGKTAMFDCFSDLALLLSALPRDWPVRGMQVDDQYRAMRRFATDFKDAFATTWDPTYEPIGSAQLYLCAMFSLKRVTSMWQRFGPYKAVIVLRMDLAYLDNFVIPALEAHRSPKEWLVVGPRHWKSGKWADDKFAIGSPRGALIYGNRLDSLMEWMRGVPDFGAEVFLGRLLKNATSCCDSYKMADPVRYLRVRSGGKINCKDIHHEFGISFNCKHCTGGRVPSAAAFRQLVPVLDKEALLGPETYGHCFHRSAIGNISGVRRKRMLSI